MQHQIQSTIFLYLSDISIYDKTAVFHEIGSCSKADPKQTAFFMYLVLHLGQNYLNDLVKSQCSHRISMWFSDPVPFKTEILYY